MSFPDPQLLHLCGAARDGELTPEELHQLEQRLATDRDARRFYARFMQLHVLLERQMPLRAVSEKVVMYPEPIEHKRPLFRPWIAGVAAAACVIFVGLAALSFHSRKATADRPLITPREPQVWAVIDEPGPTTSIVRNGRNLRITTRTRIEPGDILITAADGGASVRYMGENTLVGVFAGSRVVFERTDGPKHLRLIQGRITCDVAKQEHGKPLELLTPHARAEVLGTQFALAVNGEKTVLRVNEGNVRVTALASGEVVETIAGWQAETDSTSLLNVRGAPAGSLPTVRNLALISADDSRAIPGFEALRDGAELRLPELPTTKLNIRADAEPEQIGTVWFQLLHDSGGGAWQPVAEPFGGGHVEIWPPYLMAGDDDQFPIPKPRVWTPGPGRYLLRATPYTHPNQHGRRGETLEINFTVTR